MKRLIRFLIGALILLAFFLWVGPDKIIATISKMNLLYLPLILVFLFAAIIINSANLYLFSNLFNRLPFKKAVEINLLSWAASFFALGKLGQFSQVYLLKRNGMNVGQATAITILDKSITLTMLSIFGAMGAVIFLGKSSAYMVAAIAIIPCFLAVSFFSEFGRGIIKKYLLRKYSKIFSGFSKAIKTIISNKKVLVANFLLTNTRLLFNAFVLFFLVASVGVKADFLNLFLLSVLTQIITYIPITLNGLGIKEGGFTVMAAYIGIETVVALSAISIVTVIEYFTMCAIMIVFSNKFLKKIV